MDLQNKLFLQLKQKLQEQEDEYDNDSSSFEYKDIEIEEINQEDQIVKSDNNVEKQGKSGEVGENIQNENQHENLDQIEKRKKEKENNQCEICNLNKFKYTCPACSIRTCGLQCVREHKQKFSCSGVYRQEKQRIGKEEFSGESIKKDYQFLKSTVQDTETIRKKMNFVTKTPELLRYKLLKSQLYKKYNSHLQFAPAIMSRHRENMGGIQSLRYLIDPSSDQDILESIILSHDFANNDLLVNYGIDLSKENLEKQLKDGKIHFFIRNTYKTKELVKLEEEKEFFRQQEEQIKSQQKSKNQEKNQNLSQEQDENQGNDEQLEEEEDFSNEEEQQQDCERNYQNQNQEDNFYANKQRQQKLKQYSEYKHWFKPSNVQENEMIEIDIKNQLGFYLHFLRIKDYPTFFMVGEKSLDKFKEKSYIRVQTQKLNEELQIKLEKKGNGQKNMKKIRKSIIPHLQSQQNQENQQQLQNLNSNSLAQWQLLQQLQQQQSQNQIQNQNPLNSQDNSIQPLYQVPSSRRSILYNQVNNQLLSQPKNGIQCTNQNNQSPDKNFQESEIQVRRKSHRGRVHVDPTSQQQKIGSKMVYQSYNFTFQTIFWSFLCFCTVFVHSLYLMALVVKFPYQGIGWIVFGINLYNMITGNFFIVLVGINIVYNYIFSKEFYEECCQQNKLKRIMFQLYVQSGYVNFALIGVSISWGSFYSSIINQDVLSIVLTVLILISGISYYIYYLYNQRNS
ncbi:hypothetical protein PPERSA_09196 [Pseudocohnilembus persalinus]|uniref:HIT-type domain-containing protein n=1 Tax=Pseudocohnilembus persalinus TaxID=266149 RepID=A0A0V0QMK4_PSEPJ|nr:hypothetical protein PPERSA_09196 [Pseudocohnilembus persalinus]|eukprot:KRX03288.1 hypothetical protein PPERSA_09196 [Pseudocohnilembus persalinus]